MYIDIVTNGSLKTVFVLFNWTAPQLVDIVIFDINNESSNPRSMVHIKFKLSLNFGTSVTADAAYNLLLIILNDEVTIGQIVGSTEWRDQLI